MAFTQKSPPRSARYFWLFIFFFLLFSSAFVLYIAAEKEIRQAHDGRFKSFLLAEELRQSSDDLTRMIRTYIATSDPLYKRHYQEILDIREGRKPRPLDSYDIYWDLVLADDHRPRGFGTAISLLRLMRQAGFTNDEFAMLERAKAASDALTRTEYDAMALIESVPASDANRLTATQLLNGPAYHEAKADIMRSIRAFNVMVSGRTLNEVRAAEYHANRMRLLLLVLAIILSYLLWRLLKSIDKEHRAKSENEELFRAVFDNAAIGLAHADVQGRLRNVNPEFCKIIGYTKDEILTTDFTVQHITFPEDLEIDLAHADKLIRGESNTYSLEKRFVRKDGGVIWVNLFVDLLRDDKGKPSSFIKAIVDITDKKRAQEELVLHRLHLEKLIEQRTEELESRNRELRGEIAAHEQTVAALKESESRFRFIAENTGDVIWTMDLSTGKFSYVSPSVYHLRGYTPEEVLAQPIGQAMTSESTERVQRAIAEATARWEAGERSNLVNVTEIDQPHKDGRIIHTEVVTTIHADQDGDLIQLLGVTRDITERKRSEEAIRQMAFNDALTGLPNRRSLLDRLQQMIARAKRNQSRVALLFVDLDQFKPINDELGHEVGDWLLQSAAQRMVDCVRESDTVARIGGDEFVVLLPDTGGADDAVIVAERVRDILRQPFVTADGRRLQVSSSIGVALFPDHAQNEHDLLRVSDEAMYSAKYLGRDKVQMFPVTGVPDSGLPPAFTGTGAFVRLIWRTSYASGQTVIDRDHRNLFRMANRILDCTGRKKVERARVNALFRELVTEIAAHFSREEAILREKNFPSLEAHASLHNTLLARAAQMSERIEVNGSSTKELVDFLVIEVIAQHLLQDDTEFFPLFSPSNPPPSDTANAPTGTSSDSG